MSRYTSAYSSLSLRLEEIKILLHLARKRETSDAVSFRKEINALCRGSIVLLCGHLEAYVKEVGEVALNSIFAKKVDRKRVAPQFFYHISKDLLDEVQDTSDPARIAPKLFTFLEQDYLFWSQVGSFPTVLPVDRFNKGFSNPGFKKIQSYFNRFGYSLYKKDLAIVLKASYQPTINMVDHLVDIRNKIAHGDISVSKTPQDIEDMMKIIREYCRTTDIVFAQWCRSNLCSIR